MYKLRSVLFILTILFLVVACSQDSNQDSIDTKDFPFQVEGEFPVSGGEVVAGWITDAAVDLTQRLDVELSDVVFVAFDVSVWPDASYGCPQPDQAYDPTPKEGYLIQFRANGRNYFYHGGEDIEQFLCESE